MPCWSIVILCISGIRPKRISSVCNLAKNYVRGMEDEKAPTRSLFRDTFEQLFFFIAGGFPALFAAWIVHFTGHLLNIATLIDATSLPTLRSLLLDLSEDA